MLSSYELQRQENIRANEARLAALGLGVGSALAPRAPPPPRIKRPKSEVPTAVPERRSSRQAGAKTDGFYVEAETARGAVTVGGDLEALQAQQRHEKQAADERAAAADPLLSFDLTMPQDESQLLEGEKPAWRALYEAKRNKAAELQIEGYKVAQHRSLCEVVRLVPTTLDELRECWGFGGSGVRLQKYGELFLDALRPFAADLRAVHEAASAEAEAARAEAEAAASALPKAAPEASAAVPASDSAVESPSRTARADVPEADVPALELIPVTRDALLEGERAAFGALIRRAHPSAPRMPARVAFLYCTRLCPAASRAAFPTPARISATHERAKEIGERWVWNIANSRSLCEMVRRLPTSMEELRLCWGFGGSGVRAERHGAFLLAALKPHVADLRAVHDAARGAAHGEAVDVPVSVKRQAVERDWARAAVATAALAHEGGLTWQEKALKRESGAPPPAVVEARQTQPMAPRRRTRVSTAAVAGLAA